MSSQNAIALHPRRAKPFLKWAGGKRAVIPALLKHLPRTWNSYCEPFLGGGALFFELNPARAFLADINEELITTYRVVRDHPQELIEQLRSHRYEEEYYYSVRSQDPRSMDAITLAARMIFLNRTGYNGLYRVNRSGKFNVPFGSYTNPTIVDPENILACSEALRGVFIERTSFLEFPWGSLQAGDLVYFDPPYLPVSKTSSFTSYADNGFTLDDQKSLVQVMKELTERKIQVMLTNSDTPEARGLYAPYHMIELSVPRMINSKAEKRGGVGELLVLNY